MEQERETTLFDDLGSEDFDGFSPFPSGDPTRSHYVLISERTCCCNKSCDTVFSLTTRPHHCRRCGEVFCRQCLQYRRKLNILAQLDSDGVSCKVCFLCYHDNTYSPSGTCNTRSRTDEFVHVRKLYKDEMSRLSCDLTLERRKDSVVVPVLWRDAFNINIERECRRLLTGFGDAMGPSAGGPRRTWQELKSLLTITVPDWQKSPYWELEKSQTECRRCSGRLRLQRKRRACRVCGLALCKACTNKKLLLYYKEGPDSGTCCDPGSHESRIEYGPRLAIIQVYGSPDTEPEISLMLYVCNECKAEVSRRQLQDPHWFIEKPSGPDVPDVLSQITAIDDCFSEVQSSISGEIDKLDELLDMSESGRTAKAPTGVLSALAKRIHPTPRYRKSTDENKLRLESLRATLGAYEGLCNKLRRLQAELKTPTGGVASILRNYTKSKHDFYMAKQQRYLQIMRLLDVS